MTLELILQNNAQQFYPSKQQYTYSDMWDAIISL